MNEEFRILNELKNSELENKDKLVILCIAFGNEEIPKRQIIGRACRKILKKIKKHATNKIISMRNRDGLLIIKNSSKTKEFIKAITPKNYEKEGLYWGYPKCCVKAFEEESEGILKKRMHLLDSELSIKAAVSVFGWIPCSNNCSKTKKAGEEIIRLCKDYNYEEILKEVINEGINKYLASIASQVIMRFITVERSLITEKDIESAKEIIEKLEDNALIINCFKELSETFLNSRTKRITEEYKEKIKQIKNNASLKDQLRNDLKEKFGLNPEELMDVIESIN